MANEDVPERNDRPGAENDANHASEGPVQRGHAGK